MILLTVLRYHDRDMIFHSSYQGTQDKTRVRAGSKSYLLCYTRERVDKVGKEILQHQTTSLYIHFICRHQIIPHAPMYSPNIFPSSYTPLTQLLIKPPPRIIRHRNTSGHFLIIPNHTAIIFTSINVSTFQ